MGPDIILNIGDTEDERKKDSFLCFCPQEAQFHACCPVLAQSRYFVDVLQQGNYFPPSNLWTYTCHLRSSSHSNGNDSLVILLSISHRYLGINQKIKLRAQLFPGETVALSIKDLRASFPFEPHCPSYVSLPKALSWEAAP